VAQYKKIKEPKRQREVNFVKRRLLFALSALFNVKLNVAGKKMNEILKMNEE